VTARFLAAGAVVIILAFCLVVIFLAGCLGKNFPPDLP
jgi:hypothetical protein